MTDTLTNDTLMTDTVAIQERIGELCHQFRLPTMGAQSVSRFTAAGHGDALETLLEVLEQEAEDRRQRRISRLRTASRLPAGNTWETFEHDRVPLSLRQQLGELADGSFVDRGVNVLAFGLPGTGKTHALCAVGHRLMEAGRSVLFAPAYPLVALPHPNRYPTQVVASNNMLPKIGEAIAWEEASARWQNRNCWRRSETATELHPSGRKAGFWTSSSQ